MDNTDLSVLIQKIKTGDKDAFAQIYNLFYNKVYYYSYKITHTKDAAEEVVQNIFVKLWDCRKTLDPSLPFNNYLFKIVKSQNFKYLKKVANHDKLKEELFLLIEETHTETEDLIIYEEYLKIAESAIESLPPKRKLIYKLFRQEGKSSKEIAELLNISNNTVRVQLVEATKYLKDYLSIHTDSLFFTLIILMIDFF